MLTGTQILEDNKPNKESFMTKACPYCKSTNISKMDDTRYSCECGNYFEVPTTVEDNRPDTTQQEHNT